MRVDDGCELDRILTNSLLQNRGDPVEVLVGEGLTSTEWMRNSLSRVSWINDNGLLGLIVDNQVGVVVTTTRPCTLSAGLIVILIP